MEAWEQEPKWLRVERCRAMLYLNGFLSEAENRNVRTRIRREWPLEFVDSESDPRPMVRRMVVLQHEDEPAP